MIKKLGKQPLFLLGIGFLLFMLAGSFVHAIFFDSHVPQTPFLYDDDNKLMGAPFAPFDHSILGTDMNGNHLIYYILQGAKFTILGAFSIGLISFSLAFLIGIPLGFRYKERSKIVENTISVLYFVPASLIAYNFLRPLLWEPMSGFPTSLSFRLGVEMLVISILLVPPAAILIANETSVILKREYVTTSKVLGARPFHLYHRHLIPHIKGNLVTIFMRQTIQAILVMSHLGVFKLFFGGTNVGYGLGAGPPTPITYEWASMVGMYYDTLQTNVQWLVGVPLIFLVLFIIALMGIIRGVKNVMKHDERTVYLKQKSRVEGTDRHPTSLGTTDFTMVKGSSKS
ncbi:ABC transporter permease subunit [Halobacillus shinanisalinarum]|uniref:ABC transporter permease subunit n=1 Tax=Halobacillus shinanisalinarum TaxID=2932258 RepID=A0ABY4GYH2_9BACI|nr:ABC transporter permease subunit [Halobacillus shinanisalinarum]UOQ93114.1 ABC transporter permease subunit [Halobacillus shinanisalinarum]